MRPRWIRRHGAASSGGIAHLPRAESSPRTGLGLTVRPSGCAKSRAPLTSSVRGQDRMSEQPAPSFKLLRIESNVFVNPAFAICTAFRKPGGYLRAESFLLLSTSDIDCVLLGCKLSFTNNAGANCPIVIDETFAMDEAVRQAEVDFSIKMHEANDASPRPREWPRKHINEIPQHRLVGIWAHAQLNHQLSRVADTSDCEMLSNFINSLRAIPIVTRSPIAL